MFNGTEVFLSLQTQWIGHYRLQMYTVLLYRFHNNMLLYHAILKLSLSSTKIMYSFIPI